MAMTMTQTQTQATTAFDAELGKKRVKRYAPKLRTGCMVCRQRRIKCDETKPECRRCMIGNRPCHYSPTQRKKKYPPTPPLPPSSVNILPAPILARSPPSLPQFNGTSDVRDLISLMPMASLGGFVQRSPYDWAACMRSYSQRMNTYVFELPMRTGYHPVLDGAVKCVAAALKCRLTKGMETTPFGLETLQFYESALQTLQRALDDPIESMASHTLCATQLLFLFEALAQDIKNASIYHASGASRLIHHRGAERFETAFDKALLVAHAPVLIAECCGTATHCFFEAPAWQQVFEDCLDPNSGVPITDESVIRSIAIRCLAPGADVDATNIILNERDDIEKRAEVLANVSKCLDGIWNWLDRYGAYSFNPFHADGSPVTDILQGEDRLPGKRLDMIVLHDANILFLSRMAVGLGHPDAVTVERRARELAEGMVSGYTNEQVAAYNVRPNAAQAASVLLCLRVGKMFLQNSDTWMEFAVRNDRLAAEGKPRELCEPDLLMSFLSPLGYSNPRDQKHKIQ